MLSGLAEREDDAVGILDSEFDRAEECRFEFANDSGPRPRAFVEGEDVFDFEVDNDAIIGIGESKCFSDTLAPGCSEEEFDCSQLYPRPCDASLARRPHQFEAKYVVVEVDGTRHICNG